MTEEQRTAFWHGEATTFCSSILQALKAAGIMDEKGLGKFSMFYAKNGCITHTKSKPCTALMSRTLTLNTLNTLTTSVTRHNPVIGQI